MKRLILSLFVLSQIWGCSVPLTARKTAPLLEEGPSLWNINVERNKSRLFSGLLVIRKTGPQVEVALMDSTGIKLLEEKMDGDGEVSVVSALPMVQKKRLPELLGEGLRRLFFNGTGFANDPCRRQLFSKLCFGESEEGALVKISSLGPFVLWRADYSINNNDSVDVLAGASLNSGWFSPRLQLERRE